MNNHNCTFCKKSTVFYLKDICYNQFQGGPDHV